MVVVMFGVISGLLLLFIVIDILFEVRFIILMFGCRLVLVLNVL